MAFTDVVIISDNPGPREKGGIHFAMDPGTLPRLPVIGDGIITVDEAGTSRLYTVTEVQFGVRPGQLGVARGELTDLHVRVDLVSEIDGLEEHVANDVTADPFPVASAGPAAGLDAHAGGGPELPPAALATVLYLKPSSRSRW